MSRLLKRTAGILMVGGVLAGASRADVINVTSNISTSAHWTSDNTYRLVGQIYVLPGATLTIDAGTLIASQPADEGSLAVCKGAQLFANGLKGRPIIMTSTSDVATWTGGDPHTGTWREASQEWGNLTIMGAGYISENAVVGNVATPNAANVADMEGLTNGPSTDRYGGGDDDDDSGVVKYVSLRYGGKVVGVAVELNGLSLGGLGRDTDIHHIDIMNNVDDGIEIWGGTVNLKYFSIWNVGDDSFDVDQGWRGKAQFGLIVQGYSTKSAQGSGTGDNIFETDGAEDCHWQPVTTATIYNVTAIGMPDSPTDVPPHFGGDHATAWRANARVQYRNCIFMDVGERLVSFDNLDGDGTCGYGANGTLSWASTWTTPYTSTSAINAPPNPADFYMAQSSGNLSEIKDSIFYRNQNSTAYTTSDTVGVTPASGANNNVKEPASMPIRALTRGPSVIYSTFNMKRVTLLDPRPANDALTSVASAPNDGFFTPAAYRGAFAPEDLRKDTWLSGWSASEAFGFLVRVNKNLRDEKPQPGVSD